MDSLSINLLTPFNGRLDDLKCIINKNINELAPDDKWIIVLDNLQGNPSEFYLDDRITYLNYKGNCGAGNARNFGLTYIEDSVEFPSLLLPIDGDDLLVPGSLDIIRKNFVGSKENMISFGHVKEWSTRKLVISYDGWFNIDDLLKKYITPCGSTVLKISNKLILKQFRFSKRKRSNDNLFFMQAARYFGGFKCNPCPVLIYKVGNPKSLSGKKYKQIFYKYLALRDFGLGRIRSIYLLWFYVITGIKRYILKRSV